MAARADAATNTRLHMPAVALPPPAPKTDEPRLPHSWRRENHVSQELNDHELTVLVDAAARGAVNSRSAHHGGPLWEALSAGRKNEHREAALPFIFHGTKALADLGWERPRVITTLQELNALPSKAIVMDRHGTPWQKIEEQWVSWLDPGEEPSFLANYRSPLTVLRESVPEGSSREC